MPEPTAQPGLSLRACSLGLAILAVALAPLLAFRGAAHGPLAAVFPPWWSAARSFAAAAQAGTVVRFGAMPFVVVVEPGADGDAAATLHRAGAVLVLDPLDPGGCRADPSAQWTHPA